MTVVILLKLDSAKLLPHASLEKVAVRKQGGAVSNVNTNGNFTFEHFDDVDFDELGVTKKLVRNNLKALARNALDEIFHQAQKKIDCHKWEKEEVRDYLNAIGNGFCQNLATAFFNDGIIGDALRDTEPKTLLKEYAEDFSNR